MIERTLTVGAGGFLGAALRYLAGGLVHRHAPADFPYGTFVVNVTGCFLIGALATLAEDRPVLSPTARLFLLVGVLGGYTTFSTFAYESFALMRDGSVVRALVNVLGQVAFGLIALWLGIVAARGLS